MENNPTQAAGAPEKVYQVDELTLTIIKTLPPILQIQAAGLSRSGGYTNPRLDQYVYTHFPADGIWDFDFMADAPTGTVIMALQEITAQPFEWRDFPKELKGIRVHAGSNAIERLFSDARESIADDAASQGEWTARVISEKWGQSLEINGTVATDATKPKWELVKSTPQGINPAILLLDLVFAGELNPQGATSITPYLKEPLESPTQYASVQVRHRGRDIAFFSVEPATTHS